MPDSGQQLAVIYDTQLASYPVISSTNTNIETAHFTLAQTQQMSFQILTDGGAKVNWTYQVTNMPKSPRTFQRYPLGLVTDRDDSATSAMWSTVNSGQLAAGGQQQGTIQTYSTSVHRVGRLLLAWDVSNTGGSTAKVFAVVRTMGNS